MMQKKRYSYFIGLVLILSSCGDDGTSTPDKPKSNSINKIMSLGASRVEGDRPEFESFRYELWKLLVDGSQEFDYIGTMTDPASYPAYEGVTFDPDHEGRGGYTSGEVLAGLEGWLERVGAPDIVLFSSPGGNDALNGMSYDQAIFNINAIIDGLQDANPNVIIVIEQLAPGRSDIMTTELMAFFDKMRQDVVTIASQQTTGTSQVLTVDMATGFTDSFLADEVHYNEAGASFVASRYYEILDDLLE